MLKRQSNSVPTNFLKSETKPFKRVESFVWPFRGGSTPNAIYKELSKPTNQKALDWSKVLCFWGDERSVPPDSPENNFHAAMDAGLGKLPLKTENIFRMVAEKEIEENALAYDQLIREKIPSLGFDLIMLGMGEDGHTASLFPQTHGLHTERGSSLPIMCLRSKRGA